MKNILTILILVILTSCEKEVDKVCVIETMADKHIFVVPDGYDYGPGGLWEESTGKTIPLKEFTGWGGEYYHYTTDTLFWIESITVNCLLLPYNEVIEAMHRSNNDNNSPIEEYISQRTGEGMVLDEGCDCE